MANYLVSDSRSSSAIVTALVSVKGGVAKTTTSVNLGAALAHLGHRVLVVDLDFQASASLSVGLTRAELAPSAADVLLRNLPARAAIRSTSTTNLDVLPASVDLLSVEGDLATLATKERYLGRALDKLGDDYDFIFVDCPPGLGLLTRNALVASQAFIVPAVPQFLAVEGIFNLLLAVERLNERNVGRTRALGILPTLVDLRTRAARENLDALRQRFGQEVFAMMVRINTRLAEAPARGRTIFQHDPKATGARSYLLLAEEFLLRCQERELRPRSEDGTRAQHPPEAAHEAWSSPPMVVGLP